MGQHEWDSNFMKPTVNFKIDRKNSREIERVYKQKILRCCPVLSPQSCGTGLPPVAKKKSVEHCPSTSGSDK